MAVNKFLLSRIMVAPSATIMSITHNRLQPLARLLCLTGSRQGKQCLHIGFPLTEGTQTLKVFFANSVLQLQENPI